MHARIVSIAVCSLLMLGMDSPSHAQEHSELDALKAMVTQMQQQMTVMQQQHVVEIKALEKKVDALTEKKAEAAEEASLEKEWVEALAEEAVPVQSSGIMSRASNTLGQLAPGDFMDVSVNVDMLGQINSREDGDMDDEWMVREVELGFSGKVDPYGQFNVAIGMHPEEVEHAHEEEHLHGSELDFHLPGLEAFSDSVNALLNKLAYPWHQHDAHCDHWAFHVEEAYYTFNTLPYGLQLKLGKFRAAFGKANQQHRHSLGWVDYPRVVQYYFGNEGLAGTGGSLSWLVPNPWDHYLELTYETFKNDSHALFAGSDADDLTHLVHVKNFWDLSPASTLELGLTVATAPNDTRHGQNRTWVEGIDLTYKWRPLKAGLYKSFTWANEAFCVQKDYANSLDNEHSWGMYSAADYQFARRWSTGLRYDYAEWPDNRSEREHNYSSYLTFKQSEFAYWRLGYMHRDMSYGSKCDDDQLFLQLNVSLGAHPAHAY